MTFSAILVVFVVAVSLLVFAVGRRRLTNGAALAVTAGALGVQIAGLWLVAELTLANMG